MIDEDSVRERLGDQRRGLAIVFDAQDRLAGLQVNMVHRHPSEAQCCCLGRTTLVPWMTAVPLLFAAVVAPPAATSVDG